MTNHAVVIVGGGPTGLMLAGELALARVDVAIVERRASQELAGSRAGGLHSRTIEVLDQRGIADRFLAHGQVAQVGFLRDDPSRHQRLSDSPQLRARAVAGPHRAHTRRLGRRAGGTESERPVKSSPFVGCACCRCSRHLRRGWIESYVGKLVRKRHFRDEPAAPSPGNLFEPMTEGDDVSGWWRNEERLARTFAAANPECPARGNWEWQTALR